jgi:hypothetical protein
MGAAANGFKFAIRLHRANEARDTRTIAGVRMARGPF